MKLRKILPKKAVLSVEAYSAPSEGRMGAVRLDFNESTSPLEDAYPKGLPATWVSTYPEYSELLEKLSTKLEVSRDSILLTNGSDEAISLAANTFIEPGEDVAVVSKPCFVMIPHCLRLAGAKLDEVPVLPNLQFDIENIEVALSKNPRLAIFASPDNPTGGLISRGQIERWCEQYENTLFVIDEAYAEFSGTSVLDLIDKFGNLLVLKTFSKAWGMAGLRLGMIAGNPELLDYIRRVQLPYSVNAAAVYSCLRLMERSDQLEGRVQEVSSLRDQLVADSKNLGYSIESTSANFCLLGAGFLSNSLCDFFKDRNILLRNRSSSVFESESDPMWGYVRVSIGSTEEMKTFTKVLEEFKNNFAMIFDLDGTLVDTTESFDETVAYLVNKFSGNPLLEKELESLRLEGGYNDDWVASRELLKRRGVEVPLEEIATEGVRFYLSKAAERESLMLEVSTLESLRRKHPLYIVTGRTRAEYEPVWGKTLNPLFDGIYCVDDVPGLKPKPSPDYLYRVLSDSRAEKGAYVGNSVDDMKAAKAAGLFAFGIGASSIKELMDAGADLVLPSCDALNRQLMLPSLNSRESNRVLETMTR